MKRGVSLPTFVGFVVVVLGWLAIHERDESPRPAPAGSAQPSSSGSAAAASSPAPEPSAEVDGAAGAGGGEPAAGGGEPSFGEGGADPLGLPSLGDAPKSVRFGVVLVQYAGAQGAPEGARSKEEARKLAEELAVLAREDFDAAVAKGDEGSVANAGRMFRGILEREPEYVLFSLGEGEVSDVVDTPRGFWIVKRRD